MKDKQVVGLTQAIMFFGLFYGLMLLTRSLTLAILPFLGALFAYLAYKRKKWAAIAITLTFGLHGLYSLFQGEAYSIILLLVAGGGFVLWKKMIYTSSDNTKPRTVDPRVIGPLLAIEATLSNIEKEVISYEKLKIYQSSKGRSSLFFVLASVGTLIFTDFAIYTIPDIFIMLTLAIFIYRGKKWAIIVGMIYWTIAKSVEIFLFQQPIRLQILFWVIGMFFLYNALKIEILRNKIIKEKD